MAEPHISGVEVIDRAVEQADDVRHLARLLGMHVLDEENRITEDLRMIPEVGRIMEPVRVRAATPALASWPIGSRWLDRSLLADLRRLHATPDLAVLAMLRGLCSGGGALDRVFRATWGSVELERGDPYPVRPAPPLDVLRRMPHPIKTVRAGGLVAGVTEYELHRGAPFRVILEFRHQARLDDALWQSSDGTNAQLPVVGAVLPLSMADYDLPVDEVTRSRWFGARLKQGRWSEEPVIDALQRIHDAGGTVAILPELGVPDPDALASAISSGAGGGSVPALVVAGSAQVRRVGADGTVRRSNQAVAYLNGSELVRHGKIHPYQTDSPLVLGKVLPGKRSEWLTEPPALHIAMGERGRVAVLICADALDHYIVSQLLEAQANLVLVPAFTFEDAGWGGLDVLANLNQALVLVANGAPSSFALRCYLPDARRPPPSWKHDGDRPVAVVFDPVAGNDAFRAV